MISRITHHESTWLDVSVLELSATLFSEEKVLGMVLGGVIGAAFGNGNGLGIAEGEAIQVNALNELESKGVKIHKWSKEILDTLELAWMEVVKEESEKDADFKRSWESLSNFRNNLKTWKSLGYL